MTASGMLDLAHAQGALLTGQMSWSPPFEDLKHSQQRPHAGVDLRLQEVLDASSHAFPLHEGSGNPQRFPVDDSTNSHSLTLLDPTLALIKHKSSDQRLIKLIVKYAQNCVDASCRQQPALFLSGPSVPMGRHSRTRVRDSLVSSPESRQRHEKTHKTRSHREHHCQEPACTQSFNYSKDLSRHMKTHQRTTPLTCPHCSKTYGRTDNLNRHVREKHQEQGKTISRKSSTIPRVEPAVGTIMEPLGHYVEVVTSIGDTEMDLDHKTSPNHELMHIDVSSSIEPTEDRRVNCEGHDILPLRQKRAAFSSQQKHEEEEFLKFQALSEEIRELNSRVEHMLSSTELSDPRPLIAEDEHVCGLEEHSTPCSPEDRDEATQVLREKQQDRGPQSHTVSPCSGPVSSSPPTAAAGPGANEQSSGTSSRKRRAESNLSNDGQGGRGDRGDGFRPNGVRQKLDSGKTKDRLLCIFAVGEPSTHPGAPPHFEYVSQLLRHMRTHDFYACPSCMIKFPDSGTLESHSKLHHINTCTRKACKREQVAEAAPVQQCRHLLTAQEQWQELYALQYSLSNLAAVLPAATSSSHTLNAAPDMLDMDFDEFLMPMDDFDVQSIPSSFTAPLGSMGSSQSMAFSADNSSVNMGVPSSRFPGSLGSSPTFRRTGKAAQTVLEGQVQTLRERVQILEQRLSQPSEREQDLEMVLTNVWQALLRSGSAEAQTESGVWRLVRRFASNILSTAAQSNQGAVAPPATQTSTVPESDWQHISLPRNRESSGLYMNGPV